MTYRLSLEDDGSIALEVSHQCDTDAETVVNMTNHSYFNLAGHDSGQVDEQLRRARGYDHCLCIDGFERGAAPRHALHAEDPTSGRTLDVAITAPGAHLYTGNWLDDAQAKDGASYTPRCGFAFEPEYYPDAVHHPAWDQPVCTPNAPYRERIVYRFSTTR